MNPLSDYIVERIRVDNIKWKKFPIDGSLNDVIEFLKYNGFEQSEYSNCYDWMSLYMDDFHHKLPEFEIVNGRILKAIVFANTSKHDISGNNPMWYILFDISCSKPIKWKKSFGPTTLLSKDDFKLEMEKYFENL